MSEKTERFEMRLSQETVEQIDNWRKDQDDAPSRSEAVRRLLESSLSHSPHINDGEKIILVMLCELFKKLKIDSEFDPQFIEAAIYGGHYWALKLEYNGLFHGYADTQKDVSEVFDILDMWVFVERAYASLTQKDKTLVEEGLSPFGGYMEFPGFDENNERAHLNIARFLIEKMGRFAHFKKREKDLNSHCYSLEGYRNMLSVFLPIRPTLIGVDLSAKQLVDILKAR